MKSQQNRIELVSIPSCGQCGSRDPRIPVDPWHPRPEGVPLPHQDRTRGTQRRRLNFPRLHPLRKLKLTRFSHVFQGDNSLKRYQPLL